MLVRFSEFRSNGVLAIGTLVFLSRIFFGGGELWAGEPSLPPVDPERIIEQSVEDLGTILNDLGLVPLDHGPSWLQELWLLGRYHGQYHWAEGSNGADEGFETRRARYGFQARLLERMTIHAQMISGRDFEPFYNGFTELWVSWKFDPRFVLTVGQQKHRFTHDRNVSSRYLNYLERALLTNLFRADYTPAINVSGELDQGTYYAGLFSNATGRDLVAAFTELNSGYSLIGGIYHELDSVPGAQTTHLHLTAYGSTANENATNLNVFEKGVSSALILTRGPVSLIGEVTGGFGGERGNAAGLNLQPACFLTDRLQLALRYQIAGSDQPEGLLPQVRYESPAGLLPGDLYQAGYAGLNYYIARHRLKLMSGVEYATLGGQDVWTASTMFRFYFGPHSGTVFPANNLLQKQGRTDFLEHD